MLTFHDEVYAERWAPALVAARLKKQPYVVWNDALEDSRIRALVSETPLQAHEYDDLSRHVAVANAEMNRRAEEVRELVEARDELLRDWTPDDDRG